MTLHTRPVPETAAAVVRSLADGSLTGPARDSAIDHLRACEACAALFDRVGMAEGAATGGAAIGPLGLDRVARRLGLHEAPRTRWLPTLLARRPAVLAFTMGATALLLFVVVPAARDPEWTARGGDTSLTAPRLRAFRLVTRDGKNAADRMSPNAAGMIPVRRGDVLAFSLTNPGDQRHARWSLSCGGATTHLDGPASVPAHVVEEPLDASVDAPAMATAVLPLFVEVEP